jgi:hypothetical protein
MGTSGFRDSVTAAAVLRIDVLVKVRVLIQSKYLALPGWSR